MVLLFKSNTEYNTYSFLFLISRKENVYVMVCTEKKTIKDNMSVYQ